MREIGIDDTQIDMRAPSRILTSARILLGKTQREVANECGVAPKTVYLAERGDAGIAAVEKLMAHYERAGIRFIEPTEGEGWGVVALFLTSPYGQQPD
ncbi:helix-turn-helix domain-containing protein [Rhizobium laguerreae]|uniref:helix-turn-helix domain-containing protein n=1 Tax=Rhizobium laguerreae TaxID=1076926 RepID=UPI001C925975|nr:helix-turn-helix domain-containing protein [Rhizobium laguerreae]MBY3201777.1 helix-turn-helix transcriptional regulator [Rhizobium laguerreae]